MFRKLADLLDDGTGAQAASERVLTLHPIQLSRYLEEVWRARNTNLLTPDGLEVPPISELALEIDSGIGDVVLELGNEYPPRLWDHLIYAYMIENTRVYEIFRRVLEEYAFGERLSIGSHAGLVWLRNTEQLFYSTSPPLQIYALTSSIRPDIRAVRRNAYQRMFGVDLNHGTDDGRPYPYPRAPAANTEFVTTIEALLREAWRAIENIRNSVGPNATDDATIANLARALYDMLRVRRQENLGNLARDELFHVSVMNWFHLTLSFNTPIVSALNAQASSPAERLQKIGERVGLPAHSRSESYFRLATSMSILLRAIEAGLFNVPANAPGLYTSFASEVQETIANWSIATGRDVKVASVAIAPAAGAPVRPLPPRAPSGDGRPSGDLAPV